jgi:hypothetical protein
MYRHLLSFAAALIFISALGAGCIPNLNEPTPAQMATWDYGAAPKNYQAIVSKSPVLKSKDVKTPRLEFQGAPKAIWKQTTPGEFIYGWGGTVRRIGVQTGTTVFEYIIRDGVLIYIDNMNKKESVMDVLSGE